MRGQMRGKLALHGGAKTVPDGLAVRWPIITDEDKRAVMAVLDRGVLAGETAPECLGLEREFAELVGARYAMATGSGTSAIHCALYAAGVEPGDEVITSAFSFSGSFHPILQQNAIPVFVDVDPRTYNIAADQIEAKITDRTKAILPVHIHGLPADLDEILALAAKHGLVVVEDACQAHGAMYKGRRVGTIGRAGAFSLNHTKNFPGGEGGLLTTDDEEILARARRLRSFGEEPDRGGRKYRPYTVLHPGYQYRTQEMPAAFARSQLRRLPEVNRIAQRNGAYLTEKLAGIPGVVPPYVPPDRTSIYHKYRVRFQPEALGVKLPAADLRDRLLDALEAEGVSVALWHVDPLPAFPVFQDKVGWGKGCPWSCQHYGREVVYRREDYPETQRLLDESFVVGAEATPLFAQRLELLDYWAEGIRKVFENLDEVVG